MANEIENNNTIMDSVKHKHPEDYQHLIDGIGSLLAEGRKRLAHAVNTAMIDTYWAIGRYIVEYEQQGHERAVYGSDLINRLSKDLTRLYGKGFGKSNLLYIRKLYVTFPKSGTLSHLLTWSQYYVDLVFYHRILKCFVLIDLKRGEIQHEDIGQMNLYLNYYKAEENVEGDNEPIGIVLGASKDQLTMEYAMNGISNQIFAAQYQLYLPKREELQARLDAVLKENET